jgi:hypothetical protein
MPQPTFIENGADPQNYGAVCYTDQAFKNTGLSGVNSVNIRIERLRICM